MIQATYESHGVLVFQQEFRINISINHYLNKYKSHEPIFFIYPDILWISCSLAAGGEE
jgi:hypothetical protein